MRAQPDICASHLQARRLPSLLCCLQDPVFACLKSCHLSSSLLEGTGLSLTCFNARLGFPAPSNTTVPQALTPLLPRPAQGPRQTPRPSWALPPGGPPLSASPCPATAVLRCRQLKRVSAAHTCLWAAPPQPWHPWHPPPALQEGLRPLGPVLCTLVLPWAAPWSSS